MCAENTTNKNALKSLLIDKHKNLNKIHGFYYIFCQTTDLRLVIKILRLNQISLLPFFNLFFISNCLIN